MTGKPNVAICQPAIILGGRLRVILGIIEILNEAGIVPTILTFNLNFHPKEISEKYGRPIQVKYRFLPYMRIPKLSPDFSTVFFNKLLKYYASGYNLLINTSNSLIFLPEDKDIISYMFYPRKGRIMADVPDIHRPHIRPPAWTLSELQRQVLRQVYRLSRPNPNHKIICMTQFTCLALKQVYNNCLSSSNLPLIYPPVDTKFFHTTCTDNRTRAIVTTGRFSPDKGQLEQIKLAEQLHKIPFHIIGFADNNPYYQVCKQYVNEHNITNVHLHPDASFEEMVSLLQKSKYFLHTLVNEPFGITAVQAIAAGCIPLVHDSGGQRETVPETTLRYQKLEDIPQLLENLEMLDNDAIDLLRNRLQEHIGSFDAAVFHDRMEAVLAPYINT